MSKKSKKDATLVDITKIRLGLDLSTGKVLAGEADAEGVIIMNKDKTVDVTEDFYGLVQEINELRKLMLENKGPSIVAPTAQEKRIILG